MSKGASTPPLSSGNPSLSEKWARWLCVVCCGICGGPRKADPAKRLEPPAPGPCGSLSKIKAKAGELARLSQVKVNLFFAIRDGQFYECGPVWRETRHDGCRK